MSFCDIFWHLVTQALIRNFLWCYYEYLITSIALEKYKKNAILLKLFWYKVFVYWKLKLLYLLMDSILINFSLPIVPHALFSSSLPRLPMTSRVDLKTWPRGPQPPLFLWNFVYRILGKIKSIFIAGKWASVLANPFWIFRIRTSTYSCQESPAEMGEWV